MNIFEYLDKDPALNKSFHEAMVGVSTIIMNKIMEIYKGFEGLTSLVDVGGGTGACLNMIVSKYPSIKGINFDLPHVVQTAPTYQSNNLFLSSMHINSNIILHSISPPIYAKFHVTGIEHVGGSMVVSIPKADAIVLKVK